MTLKSEDIKVGTKFIGNHAKRGTLYGAVSFIAGDKFHIDWHNINSSNDFTLNDINKFIDRGLLKLDTMIDYASRDSMSAYDTFEAHMNKLTKQPLVKSTKEISDYEFFAKTNDGDCGCGIPRHSCDYHRS